MLTRICKLVPPVGLPTIRKVLGDKDAALERMRTIASPKGVAAADHLTLSRCSAWTDRPTRRRSRGNVSNVTIPEADMVDYKLAMLLHPDSSHPSSSPLHFATLHRAYSLLSQPSSRTMYLQTGCGWPNSSGVSSMSWTDAQMRAEAAMRRRGGAAAWGPSHRGFRDSDAGRGAWGGFQGGTGTWESYGDPGLASQPTGRGEEIYMSNRRFLSLIGAIVSFLTF
jgi:hypothetical protein